MAMSVEERRELFWNTPLDILEKGILPSGLVYALPISDESAVPGQGSVLECRAYTFREKKAFDRRKTYWQALENF
jgi:hypothetical protein